jgi:hypothetical protein
MNAFEIGTSGHSLNKMNTKIANECPYGASNLRTPWNAATPTGDWHDRGIYHPNGNRRNSRYQTISSRDAKFERLLMLAAPKRSLDQKP